MQIHQDFVGGNITVVRQEGNTFYLENQLRDTTENWFYWAFCVEGAGGLTLTFEMQRRRLGYFGPAVSHDLVHWHWLGDISYDKERKQFTYTFAPDEQKVYFAHSFLYHPDRLTEFLAAKGLSATELCKSRKGRSVPALTFGNGAKQILLTARHHACESTGSYVLEGVLDSLLSDPIPDTTVFCVPFVDYDGVVDGDQGKARAPHDHNREYIPANTPIYPETTAIRAYADANGCHYGFDFHAPWHNTGVNDYAFLVYNSMQKLARLERFAACLETENTADALWYRKENNYPPMHGWNQQPNGSFAYNMMHRPECDIALTLETTYFGTEEHMVTQENLVALGKCFAAALRKYMETT